MGAVAVTRLWSGDDLADVESFITDAPDDFPAWQHDIRGGVFLISVGQYARALQGKTYSESAETVFCDSVHNTADYMNFLGGKATNPERPRSVYGR